METRYGYDGKYSSETKHNKTGENKEKENNNQKYDKLSLSEARLDTVMKINEKLTSSFTSINVTPTSDVKTVDLSKGTTNYKIIKTLYLCALRKINPIIITNYKNYPLWEAAADSYGFTGMQCVITQSLEDSTWFDNVGEITEKYVCKSPLLNYYRANYQPTALLQSYIQYGCLFVLDEFQLLKNQSLNIQKACQKILDQIVFINSTSRMLQMPCQISLRECQIKCYNESNKMLDNQFSYINVSPTGMGKTIITLDVAAKRGLKVFVISTPAALITWEKECAKYGFTDFIGITYQTLRTKITHEDIAANGFKDVKGYTYIKRSCGKTIPVYLTYHSGSFYPTNLLNDIISSGYNIIFDEVQLAKNPKSATMQACHEISKSVVNLNTLSRIAILSATPYDKIKFSESILKIAGIVTQDKMYDYDRSSMKYILHGYGLHQVISWANKINSKVTTSITGSFSVIKKSTIRWLSHELFTKVIKDAFVTKAIANYPTKLDIKSCYYKLSKSAEENLKYIEQGMKAATGYNQETDTLGKNIDLGRFKVQLHAMEHVKLEIPARVVAKQLDENPNDKVIIYLWHIDCINEMCNLLYEYNPKIINGSIKKSERSCIIDRFQAPTTKSRLLIVNIASGSESISLDDTDGRFPRTIYIIPNYYYLKIVQSTGRCQRMSSMSDCSVKIIYCKSQTIEPSILNKMNEKEEVVSDIVGDSGIQKVAKCAQWHEQINN